VLGQLADLVGQHRRISEELLYLSRRRIMHLATSKKSSKNYHAESSPSMEEASAFTPDAGESIDKAS
jgi:hypothetical protein